MYSGNHSPCHPLDTLLQAALRLRDRTDLVFCFVGGGSEFQKVKRFAAEHDLRSILCLPYQPLDRLSASLSAADMHVVVMGDPFVGIKHPCKIYNIVALGVDFLFIGPQQSHVGDLVEEGRLQAIAHLAAHGDTDTVIRHIVSASARASQPPHGNFAAFSHSFSRHSLVPRMIAILESLFPSGASAQQPLHGKAMATGK
jgi:colanic acid biosynthesis glycosyl transferase WcaI